LYYGFYVLDDEGSSLANPPVNTQIPNQNLGSVKNAASASQDHLLQGHNTRISYSQAQYSYTQSSTIPMGSYGTNRIESPVQQTFSSFPTPAQTQGNQVENPMSSQMKSSIAHQMAPSMNNNQEREYAVIMNYARMNDDELQTMIGDRVLVLNEFDDGWGRAIHCNSGREGFIPLNILVLAKQGPQFNQLANPSGFHPDQGHSVPRYSSLNRRAPM
jgi:hypothetical protein